MLAAKLASVAPCGDCAMPANVLITPQTVPSSPMNGAPLTDYAMDPGRDPLATAMAEHVFFSRESASGGRGVGGAGCGCN